MEAELVEPVQKLPAFAVKTKHRLAARHSLEILNAHLFPRTRTDTSRFATAIGLAANGPQLSVDSPSFLWIKKS
jgi:hypothetical protein